MNEQVKKDVPNKVAGEFTQIFPAKKHLIATGPALLILSI